MKRLLWDLAVADPGADLSVLDEYKYFSQKIFPDIGQQLGCKVST